MKKLLILILLILTLPKTVHANENFVVSGETTYEVAEAASKVTHAITITNVTTEVHATDYTLSLRGAQVERVRAFSETSDFKTEVTKGELSQIKVIFGEPVVGEGKGRSFTIEYFDSSIVTRSGDVAEISVPKLA